MEETVWVYFGVLAVLIALGILGGIFSNYARENSAEKLAAGLTQLGAEADLVCESPAETMLSVSVVLPSGMLLYTKEDKLCGTLDSTIKCVPSDCLFVDETLLDLTANETRKLFRSRQYTCAFRKTGTEVSGFVLDVTCQG